MVFPKLVVAAIIVKDNKILLTKRNKFPEREKWSLPGGNGSFEKFSNPKEVIKDEVFYDLGVKFKIKFFFDYSYYEVGGDSMVVLHFVGEISEEPKLNLKEASECKYFSKDEFSKIPKKDFAFDHYEVLKRFWK